MFNGIFRIKLKNALFSIALIVSFSQIWSQELKLPQSPDFYVKRYINQNDTLHLKAALDVINDDFARYNKKETGKLLVKAASKAETENSVYLADFYSLVRQYYTGIANRSKTLEYALKQYKVLRTTGDSEELFWILIDIGNLFFDETEYDRAFDFYKKAEIIGLKKQIPHHMSVVYLNQGLVLTEKKDYNKALEYLHKSSEYRIREKNVGMAASTFVKIAAVHIELQQPDSVLKYIHLAEEYYYHKGKVDKVTEIPMYIDLVWFQYYSLLNDHEQAIKYFAKTQAYALKYNMMYSYYNNIFYEAKYYIRRGENETAINKLLSTIPYLHENGLIHEERYVYKMLGTVYSQLNHSEKSSEYLHKYMTLDDSIKKSDMESQLDVMRTIAAVYESDVQLERTKKNLEVAKINNKLQLKQRNTSIWIAALASFGFVILLGFMFNLSRNRKRLLSLNRQLKEQHQKIKINSLELERSNQIKDKLFSIIAHDLRNPLNRLMAELSIAQKSLSEKQLLDPMENTLKETINLFEGLLQWSKLDNKQNIYSPTNVSLNDTINRIIAFYLPEIHARKIEVINDSASLTVFADHNILQTLLRNLLSNAIASVSRDGSPGIIHIETHFSGEEAVEIVFSDSGRGFPEEIISGFNLHDDVTNGKGLGLSICKVLAKMSGWTMTISNESQLKGAKIVLQLPSFRKEEPKTQKQLFSTLPAEWKTAFAPVSQFKFYQISEIRKFLKSFGEIHDPSANEWVKEVEESVRVGNSKRFNELLGSLN